MPLVATATLEGRGRPLPLRGGGTGRGTTATLVGTVVSRNSATLTGTVTREAVARLSAPSVAYTFTIYLNGLPIPATSITGPLEIQESLDTPATLFTFTLTGREYAIHHTTTTWTSTPVEIWVTAGPAAGPLAAFRTWRRAFGHVLTCEQQEGPEPTLRIRCGDPSRRYDRYTLCYEFPPSPAPRGRGRGRGTPGLTRGAIVRQILEDAGFTADVPTGAVYTKPLATDSQKLFPFLQAFGEPEGWFWRLPDWTTVEAYQAAVRQPPEPPDDVWTLRDVLSIESTPPTDVPSHWVIRSTQTTTAPEGLKITKQRSETFAFYAIRRAVAMQLLDGTHQPLAVPPSTEVFQRVTALETELHERNGLVVAKITREWGWYNPRAAKLRTLGATDPPGPVDGYHWAQAFLDDEGTARAWRQEAFVLTGERREIPTYDEEGTEIHRRLETHKWHRRAMGVKNVGSSTVNVIGAGIGDDDLSWYPFEQSLTALLRLEDFGLAQRDDITLTYGPTGAVITEVQETATWYSQRTAITGVPWFLNASGAGQKHLVAPFQLVARKTTTNHLTEDGLLKGKVEIETTWNAPRRVTGANDWGDSASNLEEETWSTTAIKTTIYNVLDETTVEEITDTGAGAETRLIMGRAPRPRYRSSPWTRHVQAPFEVVLEDETAATWWGPSTEILNLDYLQSPSEALTVAQRRRARQLAITHTVIRPICPIRPGQTIHLIDPRTGLNHRCLVTRLTENWSLSPRPRILATYTLEQPL